VRVLATHSIRQFPLHFPSRASPCATRFRTSSATLKEREGKATRIPQNVRTRIPDNTALQARKPLY